METNYNKPNKIRRRRRQMRELANGNNVGLYVCERTRSNGANYGRVEVYKQVDDNHPKQGFYFSGKHLPLNLISRINVENKTIEVNVIKWHEALTRR